MHDCAPLSAQKKVFVQQFQRASISCTGHAVQSLLPMTDSQQRGETVLPVAIFNSSDRIRRGYETGSAIRSRRQIPPPIPSPFFGSDRLDPCRQLLPLQRLVSCALSINTPEKSIREIDGIDEAQT